MEYLINSFARRVGKTLRPKSQNLLKDVLPNFLVLDQKFENLKDVFNNNYKNYALDIGFGFGEQLAENARIKQDIGFIGCEPFLNGVANILSLIEEKNLENIRLWKDDARKLLVNLPNDSLDEAYLLFADPWPKKKQNKRRLVNDTFLTLLASKMKEGGKFYLATDFKPYAKWIHQHLNAHISFKNTHTQFKDYKIFPTDWIKSRYHQKAESKGLKPFFFCFEKIR